MDLPPHSVEILEVCNVSPPPNSVPTTSIPLTFFDIIWFFCTPVERILFYEFPHPTLHFTQTILPQLKHSLSLTLQHFFPLAGSLVCPPLPTQPHFLYTNGNCISLTIAESNSDFARIVKDCPRDAKEFRLLVPHLSSHATSLSSSDTDQETIVHLIRPLIAIQVTLFPNSGISICYTYRHIVGDGRTINQFIKSWASMFKSKNDLSAIVQPFYDRADIIKNTMGLFPIMWNQLCQFGAYWDSGTTSSAMPQDSLHATFNMNRLEIKKLRRWITSQFNNNVDEPPPLPHVSTFVLASAFTWVCLTLTKTENVVTPAPLTSDDGGAVVINEDNVVYYFGFPADCTDHKEVYVPKSYFGNCLRVSSASLRRSELLGENGLFKAVVALMKAVKVLDGGGLLSGAEKWIPECVKILNSGHVLNISGSPKLRVYETDFGWGRPRKSEIVHIDKSPAQTISLTESRDEEGGVEIGLALSKVGMEAFISIFERGLKNQWC